MKSGILVPVTDNPSEGININEKSMLFLNDGSYRYISNSDLYHDDVFCDCNLIPLGKGSITAEIMLYNVEERNCSSSYKYSTMQSVILSGNDYFIRSDNERFIMWFRGYMVSWSCDVLWQCAIDKNMRLYCHSAVFESKVKKLYREVSKNEFMRLLL